MPQSSKNLLKKEISDRLPSILTESIISCRTSQQAEEFLDEFITPAEKVMLGKRLVIAILLLKGYEYRAVSDLLKVSTSTVNKIANILKRSDKGLKAFAQRQIQKEDWEKILKKADRFFFKLTLPLKHSKEKPLKQ